MSETQKRTPKVTFINCVVLGVLITASNSIMTPLKTILKESKDKVLNDLYHRKHKKLASKILKEIEIEKGKTDPKLIKKSNDYAKQVLGWIGYAPWLHVYSAMAGEFKKGWIPDNYYGKEVVPKLKGKYGAIADHRGLTRKLFKSDFIPDFLYYINDKWFDLDYNILKKSEVEKLIKEKNKNLIYKTDNSEQGKGIIVLKSNYTSLDALEKNGDGVLQHYIKQHEFFNEIIDSSVASLRLTTAINIDGKIRLAASYLRVGDKSDEFVKSSSHIQIPVDAKTGVLEKYAYNAKWKKIDKHPHTGFVFANKRFPNYTSCVATVKELHRKVPFITIIGWDVVVDSHGEVRVMEWNGLHNGIKFSEATAGPIFKGMGFEELWKR